MLRVRVTQGYAYLVEEEAPSHVGNGIVEFTRTYVSVPRTRYDYTTITHSRQEIIGGELVETQETVPALVKYEYSLKVLKQIDAPRIMFVNNVAYTVGGFGTFTPGKHYLAEDSEGGIYKCGIFFRRSVLILWKAFTLRQ